MLIFVMTYIKIFLQNIAFYSTKSDTRSAIKLYKYLIRQCDKLPKGPKEHYIHMVKQSFKQHVNENDPERISQIISRAYEDCDWILKKKEIKMFLPLATSGSLVPQQNFWNAVLLYHEKPYVVNKRIVGVLQFYFYEVKFNSVAVRNIHELFNVTAILYEMKKIASLNHENLGDLILNLLLPYDKHVSLKEIDVDCFLNKLNGIFVSVRVLIPRSNSEKCLEIVILDKTNDTATFTAVTRSKMLIAPPFQYKIELMNSGHMRIVIELFDDAETSSAAWLADKLFPKLLTWACNYDPSFTTPPSLTLISVDKYSMLYKQLKDKYGQKMIEVWPKNTDPLKFVYEDIAIATYLICLWEQYGLGLDKKPYFVDLGCGNGLLVYILNEEGYPGMGIDVRKRKLWDLYPEYVKLEVKTVLPSSKFLFPNVDWIIGNHSDELTPWIPLITFKSSYKTNLFLLPCCTYDFNGKKYNRVQFSKSQYGDYLDYVQEICSKCCFETKIDKLRIPSTKKTCIVSFGRTYNETESNAMEKQITNVLNAHYKLNINETDLWIKNFQSRTQIEKVRNCTQLNKDLIKKLVWSVAEALLKDKNFLEKANTQTWNAGGRLTFPQLVQTLNMDDLKQLKNECGGLQTLLRNHRYIFEVAQGSVQLRVPSEFKNVQTYKEKPCWFFLNHPDGCLHTVENCAYQHQTI